MAVHDDYPSLTVEICVDGKPLEEYQTEEEERQPDTTTRYIECRSDTEFEIKTNFTPPFAPMDIIVDAYLDGSIMSGRFLKKHEMLSKVCTQSETNWKEVEENNKALFEEDLETLRSVGIISVVLTPILSLRRKQKGNETRRRLREIGLILEEAVKGDAPSHTIRLGPDRAIKPSIKWHVERAAEPLATFQFKYRSIAALKPLGIVPGSPSPSPISRPELSEKGGTPETTTNIVPNGVSPAAVDTPRPKTTIVTPAPPHQNSVQPTSDDDRDLTDEDIIALIKHYRGNDKGLASQSRKRLMVLLKHYEEKDTECVLVNQETVANEPRVRTKHKLTDDTVACGRGKKRKTRVVVLDD